MFILKEAVSAVSYSRCRSEAGCQGGSTSQAGLDRSGVLLGSSSDGSDGSNRQLVLNTDLLPHHRWLILYDIRVT